MKRLALLCVALLAAGCGGGSGKEAEIGNTNSQNVAKPLERAIVVDLGDSGSARVRRVSNKQTAVSVQLSSAPAKGLTAALEYGSCGSKQGLRMAKPLGSVTNRRQSWSVVASLTELTASPLAVVLRRGGSVVACGQVRQA